MKLQNEFEPIRQWARERGIFDHGDVKTQFIKLQEEVGELSAEALKQIGFKSHDTTLDKIRDNILLEAVDCLIMSLDILSQQGFSKKEIIDKANSQIEKWISNIKTN